MEVKSGTNYPKPARTLRPCSRRTDRLFCCLGLHTSSPPQPRVELSLNCQGLQAVSRRFGHGCMIEKSWVALIMDADAWSRAALSLAREVCSVLLHGLSPKLPQPSPLRPKTQIRKDSVIIKLSASPEHSSESANKGTGKDPLAGYL